MTPHPNPIVVFEGAQGDSQNAGVGDVLTGMLRRSQCSDLLSSLRRGGGEHGKEHREMCSDWDSRETRRDSSWPERTSPPSSITGRGG